MEGEKENVSSPEATPAVAAETGLASGKPKKPRSEKQQAAFEKMLVAKKEKEEISKLIKLEKKLSEKEEIKNRIRALMQNSKLGKPIAKDKDKDSKEKKGKRKMEAVSSSSEAESERSESSDSESEEEVVKPSKQKKGKRAKRREVAAAAAKNMPRNQVVKRKEPLSLYPIAARRSRKDPCLKVSPKRRWCINRSTDPW